MCFIWASPTLAARVFDRHGILEQLDHKLQQGVWLLPPSPQFDIILLFTVSFTDCITEKLKQFLLGFLRGFQNSF